MSISVNTDQGTVRHPGRVRRLRDRGDELRARDHGRRRARGRGRRRPRLHRWRTTSTRTPPTVPTPSRRSSRSTAAGQIVDAFKKAVAPSKDPDITGAPVADQDRQDEPLDEGVAGAAEDRRRHLHHAEGRSPTASSATSSPRRRTPPPRSSRARARSTTPRPAANVTLKIRVDGGAETTVTVQNTTTRNALVTLLAAIAGLTGRERRHRPPR
jgi:hypothetical protein